MRLIDLIMKKKILHGARPP